MVEPESTLVGSATGLQSSRLLNELSCESDEPSLVCVVCVVLAALQR